VRVRDIDLAFRVQSCPIGESSDAVFVVAAGSKLEDHLSANFSVIVARRRSPGETVAQTELDHAHEPRPFVAVGKRVVLNKPGAHTAALIARSG